jgi:hypothetical protein
MGAFRRSIMDQAITRSSRLLAFGGVAGIIFGIGALVWPNSLKASGHRPRVLFLGTSETSRPGEA